MIRKTLRDLVQEREDRILDHPMAMRSADSRGRLRPEPLDPIRLCYQRDAHRILHCTAFRRLRYKTQVIFSPENDHVSTRVDHSLYLASISQTIAGALGLNGDLAYAIALGHDLGHGPFGHAGEALLDRLSKGIAPSRSFQHELHSLRVVDKLASRPSTRDRGLNLTYEVRDGIVSHCGELSEQHLSPGKDGSIALERIAERGKVPITMEGCIVRMVDRIAYVGRDYEDALSVLGKLPPLPRAVTRLLGSDNRTIINNLVTDIIRTNGRSPERIGFSDSVFAALNELYRFNHSNIYSHPEIMDYAGKAERMLEQVFEFENKELESKETKLWGRPAADDSAPIKELHNFIRSTYPPAERPSLLQILVDHISLMTDRYARSLFEEIALPKPVGRVRARR